MNKYLNAEELAQLEDMLDRVGLSVLLSGLGTIADDKAQHIEQAFAQHKPARGQKYADKTAALWANAAETLFTTAGRLAVRDVSPK